MLVTLKDLEEKLTSTYALIKAYIDARLRANSGDGSLPVENATNVYAEAKVKEG